ISDVQPEKLGLLEGMEGIIPVDATKEDLGDRVRAETGGWGPQVVFEASGAAPAHKDLWSVPAPGGRIVLVGMPVEPVPFDIATAQSRGVSLETVFRYANVYQKAIDLAATDAVDLGRFVSETFPFDNAVGGLGRPHGSPGVAPARLQARAEGGSRGLARDLLPCEYVRPEARMCATMTIRVDNARGRRRQDTGRSDQPLGM